MEQADGFDLGSPVLARVVGGPAKLWVQGAPGKPVGPGRLLGRELLSRSASIVIALDLRRTTSDVSLEPGRLEGRVCPVRAARVTGLSRESR